MLGNESVTLMMRGRSKERLPAAVVEDAGAVDDGGGGVERGP
jgi:hypothetical protein